MTQGVDLIARGARVGSWREELEKSVRAVERGMSSLEAELKAQRRDISKVMNTVMGPL
jgi:hypothetical protein